jgi:hypothetical protein
MGDYYHVSCHMGDYYHVSCHMGDYYHVSCHMGRAHPEKLQLSFLLEAKKKDYEDKP